MSKRYIGLTVLLALSLMGTACGKKSDKESKNTNSTQLQELKKQNELLQAEVKKLQGQIEAERRGGGGTNAQLRVLLEQISELTPEKIDEIVQEMDAFKMISEKLELSLKNQKANGESIENNSKALEETIKLVKETREKIVDINQLREELKKLDVGEEIMEKVNGVIAEATKKLAQLDGRLTSVEGSLKEMGIKLEAEAKRLSEANAALEEKLQAVLDSKEKDDKKMQALQQTVLGLTSNVGILQQTLIDLENRLNNHVTSNSAELELLKTDLSELKNNLVPSILERLAKLENTGESKVDEKLMGDLRVLQSSVDGLSQRLQVVDVEA